MDRQHSRLTVFFEAPFWVGLVERWADGQYAAVKVIFGSEPSGPELYQWILREWDHLKFRPVAVDAMPVERQVNPKRVQRAIHKEVRPQGTGTKAQAFLKRQYEQEQADRAALRRQAKAEEADRSFQQRQTRKKERRRGH